MPTAACDKRLSDQRNEFVATKLGTLPTHTPQLGMMVDAQLESVMRAITQLTCLLWKLALPTKWWPMVPAMLANQQSALATWYQKVLLVMSVTQTFGYRWLSAFTAFHFRPTTIATKVQSILGFVGSAHAWLTALIALPTRQKHSMIIPPAIVVYAQTSRVMRLAAVTALWWAMEIIVFFYRFAKVKVFKAIIGANFIQMMNMFRALKPSTNFLFHEHAMFQHVSAFIGRWMVRKLDEHIAIVVCVLFAGFQVWPSHGRM